MTKRKIYFRADASAEIGYGHFIRTLALADMLKEEFECIFFTQQPNPFQVSELDKVCKYVVLPADDLKFNLFLDTLQGNEVVVLDNYFYTSEYEKKIKEKGCRVVSFGSNSRHYNADVVVNFTNLNPSDFSVESYTRMCLGLDWIILRTPFYQQRKKNRFNIVICIGGTDQFGFSERFAEVISHLLPHTKIQIIATERFGTDRIAYIKRSPYQLLFNQTAEQIANTFSEARIAIVSASSVAIEALSQGVNVIAGYYVDNQFNMYKALTEGRYIWGVKDFLDTKCPQKIIEAIHSINKGERKNKFLVHNAINNYRQLFSSL